MTTRESAVSEALAGHAKVESRRVKSGGGKVEWERFCICDEPLPWTTELMSLAHREHLAAVLAALDTTPQPALGDDESTLRARMVALAGDWEDAPREYVPWRLAARRLRAALADHTQPTPPAQAEAVAAVERVRALADEWHGHGGIIRTACALELRAALDPLTTARAIADTAAAEAGSADTAARMRRTGGD